MLSASWSSSDWKTKPVLVKTTAPLNESEPHDNLKNDNKPSHSKSTSSLHHLQQQNVEKRMKLPVFNISSSFSPAHNSPASSPLMQRARCLAPSSEKYESSKAESHHNNNNGVGQDNFKEKLSHPANVFQVNGRKRSVSYSNFSNFYET